MPRKPATGTIAEQIAQEKQKLAEQQAVINAKIDRLQKKAVERWVKIGEKIGIAEVDATDEEIATHWQEFVAKKQASQTPH